MLNISESSCVSTGKNEPAMIDILRVENNDSIYSSTKGYGTIQHTISSGPYIMSENGRISMMGEMIDGQPTEENTTETERKTRSRGEDVIRIGDSNDIDPPNNTEVEDVSNVIENVNYFSNSELATLAAEEYEEYDRSKINELPKVTGKENKDHAEANLDYRGIADISNGMTASFNGQISRVSTASFLDAISSTSDFDAIITIDSNHSPFARGSVKVNYARNLIYKKKTASNRHLTPTYKKRTTKLAHTSRRPRSKSNRMRAKTSIFDRLYQHSRLNHTDQIIKRTKLVRKTKSERLYGYERTNATIRINSKRSDKNVRLKKNEAALEDSVFLKLYSISSKQQVEGKYRRLQVQCKSEKLQAERSGRISYRHEESQKRLQYYKQKMGKSRRSLEQELLKPNQTITFDQANRLSQRLLAHKKRKEERMASLRLESKARDKQWGKMEIMWGEMRPNY